MGSLKSENNMQMITVDSHNYIKCLSRNVTFISANSKMWFYLRCKKKNFSKSTQFNVCLKIFLKKFFMEFIEHLF